MTTCARGSTELTDEGLLKLELVMTTPQGAHVEVDGRGELLNLCANNYLGLANHPEMVAAAHEALDRWGYGMASVRFICGTQDLHRQLEERLSEFLGTEDTILFGSCFDANGGVFEALLDERDAVISDQLNHASIIDGIRLCKARRLRYANGDMDELRARLEESADARFRLVATDGVFSMDGYAAKLDEICDLAERHDALVLVDDSHAVGFVGPQGRGTHAQFDVVERVDVLTGTLGKAVGGASGGYVSGRQEIVDLLRQRARPVSLLQQRRPRRRRREPPRARPDRAIGRPPRSPLDEHTCIPVADDRARLRRAPRRPSDRARDGRRRRRGRRGSRRRSSRTASSRSRSPIRSSRSVRRGSGRRCPPRTRKTTSNSRCGRSSRHATKRARDR